MPSMDSRAQRFLNKLEGDALEKARQEFFSRFDKNREGKIPISEVKEIAVVMGVELTKKKLKRMTKQMDRNRDGYVDVKEFCDFCRSNPRWVHDIRPNEGCFGYFFRVKFARLFE